MGSICNIYVNLNDPTEQNYKVCYEEFNTSEEQVKRDAQTLKNWFYAQPHLPHLTFRDDFFERIFERSKFSIQRAKETLDLHFTLKTALPELYASRDPTCSDIRTINKHCTLVMLPGLTKQGHRVYMLTLNDKDATLFNFCDIWRWTFILHDHVLFNRQERNMGVVVVHDYANISMGHATKVSADLPLLKKAEICITKGCGTRIKGIHFLNPPPFMGTILSMLKATLKSKLMSRIHLHTTLESLHAHVDRHVLPEDYGGEERKLSVLAADWWREVEAHRDWFSEHEVTGRVDETKRSGKAVDTNEMFGLVGSFKKLAVD